VIKVSVGRGGQLKRSEADIIQGFIINDHTHISILYQLMHREGSVVGFNDCIRDLG
jgi:hypothetical protein